MPELSLGRLEVITGLAALVGHAYDLAPHQARDELDGELGCLVAVVKDGVDLDDIERGNYPSLVDELHNEVSLAVAEAAPNRGADARGDVGIDDVEVEGEVDPLEVREIP